jgi:hypothetical protein
MKELLKEKLICVRRLKNIYLNLKLIVSYFRFISEVITGLYHPQGDTEPIIICLDE